MKHISVCGTLCLLKGKGFVVFSKVMSFYSAATFLRHIVWWAAEHGGRRRHFTLLFIVLQHKMFSVLFDCVLCRIVLRIIKQPSRVSTHTIQHRIIVNNAS